MGNTTSAKGSYEVRELTCGNDHYTHIPHREVFSYIDATVPRHTILKKAALAADAAEKSGLTVKLYGPSGPIDYKPIVARWETVTVTANDGCITGIMAPRFTTSN